MHYRGRYFRDARPKRGRGSRALEAKRWEEAWRAYGKASALFICLERALTLDLIRAVAEQKPERVVCLDEGFAGNDPLKANAVQTFKTKGVTSFKTV